MKEGHCHFADKHGADFSFEKEQLEEAEQQAEQDAEDGVVLCKRCGAENPKEMFYCCNCGAPLYGDDKSNPKFQAGSRITVTKPEFQSESGYAAVRCSFWSGKSANGFRF